MKSSFRGFVFALMALVFCMTALAPAAFAEEDLTVLVNAEVTLEGTLPAVAEEYTIRMTADNDEYPMPAGKLGGVYDLVIEGAGSAQFPKIQYSHLGIYTYTIRQLPGADPDCQYDARSYRLTVSVINAEHGGGFDIEVAMREDGKEEKTDTVLFHNAYKVIPPTPVPTTPPGEPTATGVSDRWPMYLGGSLILMIAAGIALFGLRSHKDGSNESAK